MKNKLSHAMPVIKSTLLFGSLFALCSVSTAQMIVKNSAESGLVWITQDGKAGIGTSAPDYKLEVMGGISGAYTPKYSPYQSHGLGQGAAAIYNDNDQFKELIILGNNSKEDGDRNVSVYDHLYVPRSSSIGTRTKNAKLTVAGLGPDIQSVPGEGIKNVTLAVTLTHEQNHTTYGISSYFTVAPSLTDGGTGAAISSGLARPGGSPYYPTCNGALASFDALYPAGSGITMSGVRGLIYADEASYYLTADPANSVAAGILGGVQNNSPENDRIYGLYIYGAKSRFGMRVGIAREPDATYMLDVNGNIRCNALTQTSDSRFKTDVEPLTRALDRVSALQGVAFNWNDPSMGQERQIGFIAQEVEKVLPEVVTTDGEGYKSLAYDRMTPVLVEAIKELKTELEAQKAENRENRRKIELLEKQ